MKKDWLIVSWKMQTDDSEYGRLIGEFYGTYEEVCEEAKKFIPHYSPVGVVGEIK